MEDLRGSIEKWKTENPELAPYFDAQYKKFKAVAELQRLKRTIKKMVFLVDKLNKETSEWKEQTIPMKHLDRFIMAFEEIVYMNITKEDRAEWDD